MQLTNKELEESWRKDPKNWKLGNFYFNKKDKRIFVEKPNPDYGITINFANPKSFLAMLLGILFFGFVVYMINKNK
jgi:uncharacterized membrane protein